MPTAITASADGAGVFVAGGRSIYQIDEQVEGFLRPILATASTPESNSAGPESSSADKVPSDDGELILGEDANPAELAYLNGGASIDKLVAARGNRFFMRSGGNLLQGVLSPGGTTLRVTDPGSGQPFSSGSSDIAVSPDGRTIFVTESSTTRLAKIDTSGEQEVEEVILASKPTALAVTAPPVAQNGSLVKFSGDNQTVQSGSAYSLVAQALEEDGDPQSGVFVTVNATVPISSCLTPSVPTDSNGLVT